MSEQGFLNKNVCFWDRKILHLFISDMMQVSVNVTERDVAKSNGDTFSTDVIFLCLHDIVVT